VHSKDASINSFFVAIGGQCLYFFSLHQKAGDGSHHFETAMGRGAVLLAEAKEEWKEKTYVRWQKRKGEQLRMDSRDAVNYCILTTLF